jgi:S-methylmethionine-dependent homocysteine/selenocysteine methylase
MLYYKKHLPQMKSSLFLTDGGIETDLIFNDGIDLPMFASFVLLDTEQGRQQIMAYYRRYLEIAKTARSGFILESPTWRSSPDWGEKLGYSRPRLEAANRHAIALMTALRQTYESSSMPIVISGCVGPRGDGYDPGQIMTPNEARAYHSWQVGIFADTDADLVSAMTMTNVNEAIGIAQAARAADIPAVISFTVETDGRLPTGQELSEAIRQTDEATSAHPAYYMINCAHPDHFHSTLVPGAEWVRRIRGIRANASRCSHAELNEAAVLDPGNPLELGNQYAALRKIHTDLTVLGGCCGTDARHISRIAEACLRAA